ncbi:MAG: hypothetical protein A2Z97_01390 [Bdellovibrionales bacterium GWB1_52_6]|nr:MAG: hypothetical protein A2Z97_01390 [Bdellovibrionales bacterium GWB1_52_6]OFZ04987.1 MAG: hypothetical protein A2X97_00100 [Bdellovibrionales bacterium GWA1_52_35]
MKIGQCSQAIGLKISNHPSRRPAPAKSTEGAFNFARGAAARSVRMTINDEKRAAARSAAIRSGMGRPKSRISMPARD